MAREQSSSISALIREAIDANTETHQPAKKLASCIRLKLLTLSMKHYPVLDKQHLKKAYNKAAN